jgi:PAS domain S-box-containing protein
VEAINEAGLLSLCGEELGAEALVRRMMESGAAGWETTWRGSDGRGIPVSINAYAVAGEPDAPPLIEGTLQDITQRRLADMGVRESETRFRILFEALRDAIVVTDHDRILDCNSTALGLFGLSSTEELASRTPLDFCPPAQPDGRDSREALGGYVSKTIAEGSCFFEWTCRRPDGSTIPHLVTIFDLKLN